MISKFHQNISHDFNLFQLNKVFEISKHGLNNASKQFPFYVNRHFQI